MGKTDNEKIRHRSNLNFAVTTFFGLIALITGFYIGLISSKGPLVETGKGTDNSAYYQHIWQNRPDVFNLLLIAIAYSFVMILLLLIFERFGRNKQKKSEIQDLERLGDLLHKGILTQDEFDKLKGEMMDDEDS